MKFRLRVESECLQCYSKETLRLGIQVFYCVSHRKSSLQTHIRSARMFKHHLAVMRQPCDRKHKKIQIQFELQQHLIEISSINE